MSGGRNPAAPRLRLLWVLGALLLLAACAAEAPVATPDEATAPTTAPPEPAATDEATAQPPPAAPDEAAPVPAELDFVLPGVQGGQVRGADLAGTHLALWFWAPW